MKAVHMSTVHTSSDTRIVDKECASLAGAGWDVVAIFPGGDDRSNPNLAIKGVPAANHRWKRVSMTSLRVLRRALHEKASVYHFHDPELIPIGLFLRLFGKIVIYDVHETHYATVAYKGYLPKVLRRPIAAVLRRVELLAARVFSGIVAATPKIATQFDTVRHPVVVVQNYPILLNPRPTSAERWRDRTASIVYMGAMSEGRGVSTLVDAMGLLPDDFPAQLFLAGALSDKFGAFLRTKPGWKRVTATGELQRDKLAQLLETCRAGLVVLKPEANYVESYPTKMFEYMAAELPVIASDFPLWREIIQSTGSGVLVDPQDPTAIAHAIVYLLTNDQDAERMGRAGRRAVLARYHWASEGEKLTRLYTELASSVGQIPSR
jgi:glycosyltransferase involved in cell wall biosynthesis